MQDACHMYINLVNGLARHEFLGSSVDRAPARCLGGHGFDSRPSIFPFSHGLKITIFLYSFLCLAALFNSYYVRNILAKNNKTS